MRPFLLLGFFLVALLLPYPLNAQIRTTTNDGIEGYWVGGTDAPGQWMSLQVQFKKAGADYEGALDGFFEVSLGFDFPAIQKLKLKRVSLSGQEVRFDIPVQGDTFVFQGTLTAGGITGIAVNAKRRAPLHLVRVVTRMGVAALIYDKRGVGQSGGDWRLSATTFNDLAGDALAGVHLLQARKDIKRKQIGLQGHSQAAEIIPIAAAESNSIAFVIIASGGGVKYEGGVRYEKKNDLISAGRFSEQEIETAVNLLQRVHDYIIRGIGERNQLETDYLKAQTQAWFDVTDLPRFRTLPTPDAPLLLFARKELGFDPAPYVERLKIPVLVLLGEQDKVVPVAQAAQRWRESLNKAGNMNFEIEIINGADHGLRIKDEKGKRIMAADYWGLMSTWLFIQLDGVRRT